MPVLILTAKSSEMDRVLGLELGADDYVIKPFSIMELMARIKSIIRRTEFDQAGDKSAKEKQVQTGRLNIDPERRKVILNGTPVDLTAKEFDLLYYFASHPGRVFSRSQLLAVAKIPEKGRLDDYLYIMLASEIYDSSIQKFKGSHFLRLSLCIIVNGVLFAIVAGFLIFAFMTRRLKKLSLAMDSFKEGATINKDLIPAPPDKIVNDEIDQLSVTFYKMAEHVAAQMNDIKDADTLRRDLIANVSHDLRTPIATLQLKGLSLEPEERSGYLETARKQCDRLGKLVGDLFVMHL